MWNLPPPSRLLESNWASGMGTHTLLSSIADFMHTQHMPSDVCRLEACVGSNKLERVMPHSVEIPLIEFKTSIDPTCRWGVEGGGTHTQHVRQTQQYDAALTCLLKEHNEPLTLARIQTAHEIMLDGAEESDTHPCNPGVIRTTNAHAGGHTFTHPSQIHTQMHRVLTRFNTHPENPIFKATDLAAGLVATHPFTNGNGRMFRLLFSYGLMAHGFPWPVVFTSGRSREYKHYITALQRAQSRGDHSHLYTMALVSVHRQTQKRRFVTPDQNHPHPTK